MFLRQIKNCEHMPNVYMQQFVMYTALLLVYT